MWQFSIRGLFQITALFAIGLALFRLNPYLPFLAVFPAAFGRRVVRFYRMYSPTTHAWLWFVVACFAATLFEPLLLAVSFVILFLFLILLTPILQIILATYPGDYLFESGVSALRLFPIWTGIYLALHFRVTPLVEARLRPQTEDEDASYFEENDAW